MSVQRTGDGLLRAVVIVLGVLLLVPVLTMLFAMPMMGMMGWWGGGTTNGFSPLWGLGMFLLWLVVLVGAGYLVYRAFGEWIAPESGTDPAIEELRMAYARGDLTEEEFEERRRTLRRE